MIASPPTIHAPRERFSFRAGSFPALPPACIAVLATAYGVETFSPIGRPVWFDEFLQFAFGAAPSTSVVWKMIQASGESINHGQTGILALLQYWSLSLFGASAWALRWPSVLATACMFFGACMVFQRFRYAFLWQAAVACALLLQWNLMHHAGEARPYILLCAAVALVLAYYLAPSDDRDRPFYRGIGYAGVVTGALFHPYFAVYWAGIVLVAWIDQSVTAGKRPTIASFFRTANLALLIVGACCYFVVGELSWLRGGPQHNFDPFQWLKKDSIAQVAISTHFDFMRVKMALYAYGAALLGLLVVALRRHGVGALSKSVAGPLLIILLAFALTLLVSYISWRTNYWIAQRQWVASIMLVPIATVLLFARLNQLALIATFPGDLRGKSVAVLVPALLLATGIGCLLTKSFTLDVEFHPTAVEAVESPDWRTRVDFTDSATATTAANRNIRDGGPVAPEFLRFYCQMDYVRRAVGALCDSINLPK